MRNLLRISTVAMLFFLLPVVEADAQPGTRIVTVHVDGVSVFQQTPAMAVTLAEADYWVNAYSVVANAPPSWVLIAMSTPETMVFDNFGTFDAIASGFVVFHAPDAAGPPTPETQSFLDWLWNGPPPAPTWQGQHDRDWSQIEPGLYFPPGGG